ncbi:MAG: phosphate acyltransferase [Defluviitaleaceae bacterium]|nr:phosphate acyltransferase [Defluviitaleaceae bacterium]
MKQTYKNFYELTTSIQAASAKTIVVAAAEDMASLSAVSEACGKFPLKYIFVGDRDKIKHVSDELGFAVDESRIISASSFGDAAARAVSVIRDLPKGTGILMKGKVDTPTFLSCVLDKENGIRSRDALARSTDQDDTRTMSHIAMLHVPGYHKLITITDGGMCAHPTFKQKVDIIHNVTDFLNGLGIVPKIAVLSASEAINPKIQESVDAYELAKLCQSGGLGDCIVEGPLSFDLAANKKAAEVKGIESQISGDVDVLLAPSVTAGNCLAKGLIAWGGATMAGAVLGAQVPIVLVSRGASAEEKLLSIAICAR